jgi:hypothetical protein
VTVALLLVGAYRSLSSSPPAASARELVVAVIGLALVVGGSLALSAAHWGAAETWEFVAQQRQRPDLLVSGGSWLLHLPSTISLVLGLPLYVLANLWFFRRRAVLSSSGAVLFVLGVLSIIVATAITVPDPVTTTTAVFCDPRYLGHSVRELATFSLTYFPIPLAWWLFVSPDGNGSRWSPRLLTATAATAGLFTIALAYQVVVPLEHGVGELAQSPEFAHGGRLSIGYLLASHFFEHFLDTLFFALLCVILAATPSRRSGGAEDSDSLYLQNSRGE